MSDNSTPVTRASKLSRNMTAAEKLIWQELRNRKFLGLSFYRQYPLIYQVVDNKPRFFIADFFCYEKQLVIEVEGKIHDFQNKEDEHREEILKGMDLNILRIRNEETKNRERVLARIKAFLGEVNREKIIFTHARTDESVFPFLAREGQT